MNSSSSIRLNDATQLQQNSHHHRSLCVTHSSIYVYLRTYCFINSLIAHYRWGRRIPLSRVIRPSVQTRAMLPCCCSLTSIYGLKFNVTAFNHVFFLCHVVLLSISSIGSIESNESISCGITTSARKPDVFCGGIDKKSFQVSCASFPGDNLQLQSNKFGAALKLHRTFSIC